MTEENSDRGSSAGSKRKRTTSVVWEDFEKLPIDDDGIERAICRRCGQIYIADSKTGTSSMLRHYRNCGKGESHCVVFDQDTFREKLAVAIIKHNLPYSFAEYEGIRNLFSYLQPEVSHISRNTLKADTLKMFDIGKETVKHCLESIPSRICLTSDLWSSIATDGYLALTAHYVDKNWVLQKWILNFRHVPPPHNGPLLAEKIIQLLKNWGIERKIFSLTLDNEKYNDGLVNVLKQHQRLADSSLCGGEYFHIRCAAHILNLIVQAGLQVINESIHKVRESVKYVRGSEARKMRFAECIYSLSLDCSKKVRQDVQIRWNSTYLMLESALVYRRAFYKLKLTDMQFKTCPTEEEWSKIERIARLLQPFYEITTLFSGTLYPTANLYFHRVWKIQLLIAEEIRNPDLDVSAMAQQMKEKFDKYWESYSMVLSFAVMLDPRYKLRYVKFCLNKLCAETSKEKVRVIREKFYMLFEGYIILSPSASPHNPSSVASSSRGGTNDDITDEMNEFDMFESQLYGLDQGKSQLDVYLEEPRKDWKQNLDVLTYWKDNQGRFPELSMMARDILSIPITTVASKSAFSVGGRIISKYRSSILPSNAEALLCTRDWLYGVPASEDLDEELTEDFGYLVARVAQEQGIWH